ncbi:hypothetical protein AB0425_17875 [Actinosynnema sp. NPDC051121]
MTRVPPPAPTHATCNHCLRDQIVVDRQTALLMPHRRRPRQRGRRVRNAQCPGSGKHYTSTPDATRAVR